MSSSKIDYTPMILAQLTDLQMRLTKQDETISALKAEVERLSGRPVSSIASVPTHRHGGQNVNSNHSAHSSHSGHSLKTAVRLQQKPDTRPSRDTKRTRPQVAGAGTASTDATDKAPYNLNDLIKTNEEVTIKVGTGKDEEGNFISTFAYATFDGTDLTVTKCELVPSLIGLKTAKPGEILYKFMEELKNGGHINRTFSVGPWKLCFVQREGKLVSLEDLRRSA